jgi:hypothetical protein
MVTQSSIPRYLREPLEMMGELRSTVVEDVEQYLGVLLKNQEKLQILAEACHQIVEHNDQTWLQRASVDRRHRVIDENTARAVIHLLVLFGNLAERGIAPFCEMQWRAPIQLVRADYVPPEVQPLLAFALEITHGSSELVILDDLDRMLPQHRARLHCLGKQLSQHPALALALKEWLQHKPNAAEVEIVQRMLGMLDFLGYQW